MMHNTSMSGQRTVRVSGQLNGGKQLLAWTIHRMGDHLATTIFFSLAENLVKLGKFASSV